MSLYASSRPSAAAEGLVSEAHGQERPLGREQLVDGRPRTALDLGVVAAAWVTGPGPDDDQVGAVEAPRA